MNRFVSILALAGIVAIAAPSSAQLKDTPVTATVPLPGAKTLKSEPPHAAQNLAAFKKSVNDPAFRAAYRAGDAVAAQRVLVRNGASPDLVFGLRKTVYSLSTGGTAPDQDYIDNGTCVHWHWIYYTLASGTYSYLICDTYIHMWGPYTAPWPN
jgi:hypothetical protein